jgi:hypothetical protein
MAEDLDQQDVGEVEAPPEAIGFKQVDTHGFANSTLWRFGIEDLERLPFFAGQGMWQPIGPAPLSILNDQIFQGIGPDSGEVVDIAIDPTGGNATTIYIATNNGGVWKSVNGGASWQAMSDFLPSSSIGAVALDPGDPKIVYAGTGNLFEGGGGMPKAVGLFKSVDGGVTWAHMDGGLHASVFADQGINRIVCPAPNTVLVACNIGLFFSKDGGLNFGNNHPDFNNGTAIRTGFISALVGDNSAITVLPITNATGPGPIVITAANHGFQNGDRVYIGGVAPTPGANGSWLVDRIVGDDNSFSLRNSVTAGVGATSGFAMGPAHPTTLNVQAADREGGGNLIVIRSAGHGLVTGDFVAIHGVQGNNAADGSWLIRVRNADQFELVGSHGNAAYTGGGIIDAPRHPAPQAITGAVNDGTSVRVTTGTAHGFLDGDQVTLNGLPGIAAPNNVGFVTVVDATNFRSAGLHMNAAYPGGGTVAGPAAAWNSAYFASAGPTDPGRGLFRLTVCSDGGVVLSDNLMTHPGVPGSFGRIAFTQSLLPRPRTLYISVQNGTNFIGLFTSTDSGGHWTLRPVLATRVATDGGATSSYDLTIGVDPQDPPTSSRRCSNSGGPPIAASTGTMSFLSLWEATRRMPCFPDSFPFAATPPAPACCTGIITNWCLLRPLNGRGPVDLRSRPPRPTSEPTAVSPAATTMAIATSRSMKAWPLLC